MNEFYLSEPKNVEKALKITGLSFDELEYVVGGRFKGDHWKWPNELKGQLVVTRTGAKIVHHFTKQKLWEMEEEYELQYSDR